MKLPRSAPGWTVASFNMGVYYLLAAVTDWQPFFRLTVVFRLVTFAVLTALVLTHVAPARFFGVALWEGFGALVTGGALWLQRHRVNPAPVRLADAVR